MSQTPSPRSPARFRCITIALSGLAALAAGVLNAQSPVFDCHVHLHYGQASLEKYEAHLSQDQVEVAGAGVMWFGGINFALAGRPNLITAGNDGIIALAAKNPKLIPIATVHPYDGPVAIAELERVVAQGVKMLKVHPHTQRFDPDDVRVETLMKRAGALGVTVLFDNANILPGDSEKLFNLALRCHETQFIFTHLGGMNFRFWNILKLARTAEGLVGNNINFDISGVVVLAADSPIEEEFIWTLRNVGIDHVLLGSDYPQITLKGTVDALEKLDLTAEEKAKIRYENALRLFPFPKK